MLQTVWTWQPALYLFLGGMGAGTFIMAAILYLMNPQGHKRTICLSMWAAVFSLGIGLVLLLTELTAPLRGLMMWQSFSHFTSWMTFGAWGLFCAIIVFGVSALLATPFLQKAMGKRQGNPDWDAPRLRKALAIIGMLLGAFVAIYTGVLLMMAPGVPLWNTPLLPCLFTVSAFDTGIALVEVIGLVLCKFERFSDKAERLMHWAVVVLVVSELAILAILLGLFLGQGALGPEAATATASAQLLTEGILAPYFWVMVVAIGLVVPLAMAVAGTIVHRKSEAKGNGGAKPGHSSPVSYALMAIGAIGALIGGCELRFLILAAGNHAEIVDATIHSIIG